MGRFQYLVLLYSLAIVGCTHHVYVDQLDVDYPNLMVSQKVEMPLIFVLEPDELPDRLIMQVGTFEEVDIRHVHGFVDFHLVDAFSTYFETIDVIEGDDPRPADPYIEAHVKLDRLAQRQGRSEMTWSFALRVSDEDEYTLSFAGTARGGRGRSPGGESLTAAFSSMFSDAVAGVLETYVDKEVHQALRERQRSGPRLPHIHR